MIPYFLALKSFSPTFQTEQAVFKKKGYFLKVELADEELIADVPHLMGYSPDSLNSILSAFNDLKHLFLQQPLSELLELSKKIKNPSLSFGFQSLWLFNDANLPVNKDAFIVIKKNALLDINSNDLWKNIERAEECEAIKIKVGRGNTTDEGRKVKLISEHLKKKIRLDANQSWNKKEYLNFIKALGRQKKFIEYIEEPLRPNYSLADIEELYHHSELPYAIDERFRELCLKGQAHLIEPHFNRGLKAVILKPSLGLSLIDYGLLIERYKKEVKWVVSSAFETDLGLLALGYFIKKSGLTDQEGGHGLDTLPVDKKTNVKNAYN